MISQQPLAAIVKVATIEKGAERIAPLTSIRFFAALYVVLYHTFPDVSRISDAVSLPKTILYFGFTSVGFFFVLSGYILAIVHPLLIDWSARRRFWIARVARIYPIYILSILWDLPRLLIWRIGKYGIAYGTLATGATLGAHVTMMQAWFPVLGGLDFPSWSLSVEAFFYLMFPFLIRIIGSIQNIFKLIMLVAVLYLAALAVPTAAGIILNPLPRTIEFAMGQNPLLRLPEFSAGIALAVIHRMLRSNWSERAQRRCGNCCLFAAALGIFAVLSAGAGVPFIILHNGFLLPIFCCLILGLAMSGAAIVEWLSKPVLVRLGEASYALYLLHIPVFYLFKDSGVSGNFFVYTAYLSGLIGLSIAAYSYVERPLRLWIVARA